MTKVLYFPPAYVSLHPMLLDLPDTAAAAIVSSGAGAYPVPMPLDRLPMVVLPVPTPTPSTGGPYRIFGVSMGQSNGDGRGQFNAAIDTEQANITQNPAIARSSTYQKTRASVFPLFQVEDRTSESFLSPTNWSAKIVATTIGANDQIQIIPYSWGGTSLLSSEANSAPNPPQWSVGRSLQQGMIDHLKAAIALARVEGFTPIVKWFDIIQGEADNRTVAPADFKAARIAQINDIIAQVPEAANAVFILGGYLPEKLAVLPTLQALEDVNKQIAAEMPTRVKYVRGPGGYMLNDGMEVHYTAAGSRVIGRLMGAAAAGITLTPRVTFTEDRTIVEGTGGTGVTNVSVQVRRDTYAGAANIPVTLTLGTAIASDFPNDTVPSNLQAVFNDGADLGLITFQIKADAIAEQNKTFSLTLVPPAGYEAGAKPTANILLQDDDNGGAQTWFTATFTAPDGTAASSYVTDTGETVTGAAGFLINGGELYSTGSGNQLGQVEWTPPADGAFEIEADLVVKTLSGGQAIRWRIQDGNNFLWVALPVSGTGNVGVYRQSGGSPAVVGTIKQPPGGIVAGNTYRIIIRHEADGKLKVTIDGFSITRTEANGVETGDYVMETTYATGKVGWRQSGAMTATTGIHITNVKTRPLT